MGQLANGVFVATGTKTPLQFNKTKEKATQLFSSTQLILGTLYKPR